VDASAPQRQELLDSLEDMMISDYEGACECTFVDSLPTAGQMKWSDRVLYFIIYFYGRR